MCTLLQPQLKNSRTFSVCRLPSSLSLSEDICTLALHVPAPPLLCSDWSSSVRVSSLPGLCCSCFNPSHVRSEICSYTAPDVHSVPSGCFVVTACPICCSLCSFVNSVVLLHLLHYSLVAILLLNVCCTSLNLGNLPLAWSSPNRMGAGVLLLL